MEIRKFAGDILDIVRRGMADVKGVKAKIQELPHVKTQICDYLSANFSLSNHRPLAQTKVSLPNKIHHFFTFKLTEDNLENFKCEYREKGVEGLLEKLSCKEIEGLLKSDLLKPVVKAEIFRVFEQAYPENAQKKKNIALKSEILQSLPLFADSWNDPVELASNLVSVLKKADPQVVDYFKVVDYYFGNEGLFPISDLSLEQNKALQEVLTKTIPISPSSQKDLLNCTVLYGLRMGSNYLELNILSDSCDLANLFLDIAKGSIENPKPHETAKEDLGSCLDFFRKTILPILDARVCETRDRMGSTLETNMVCEARRIINRCEDLLKAYPLLDQNFVAKQEFKGMVSRDVMEKITEDSIPQERVKQLILDEFITKERERNSDFRCICKEFDLKQLKHEYGDDIAKMVNDLDNLAKEKAKKIDHVYEGFVARMKKNHDENQFWVNWVSFD